MDIPVELTEQLIDEQIKSWKVAQERLKIQNRVAGALDDSQMKESIKKDMERVLKAIETLELMMEELKNGKQENH